MIDLTRPSLALGLVVLFACGGPSQPAGQADGPGSGTAPAATDAAGAGSPTSDPGAASTGAPTSAATSAPTAAPEAAGEKEAAKDPSPLVIELTVKGKNLDDAARATMEKEALALIRKSTKLALPTSKGVTAPRRVTATLTAEPPTGDAKGFTVKLGMTGVTKDGQCPLFDLDQKLTMEGGKKESAADVAELRKAAVVALFDELEKKSPTLKPNANCTAYK